MKKIFSKLLFIFFFLLSFQVRAEPLNIPESEIQGAAQPILDNLLDGLKDGDYQKYSKDFDGTLKEALPETKFKQTRQGIFDTLGKFQSQIYLGSFNQNQQTIVLWKGKFSRNADDVLIKLVLSKREGQVFVVGLWFQ